MSSGLFTQESLKGVTHEEMSKLTKAMKDGQFREHMDEYCKEVSDPANRKEYIQYLEQLEAQGEMPEGQQLLRGEPGCCVKTAIRFKNGQTQKLFINIVHSDMLDDLQLQPANKEGGRQVHLPYSLSPPRPDRDLKDNYCMTCDCAVSTRTFFQAVQNPQILKMIVDTACDGLGSNFLKGYEEVRKDFKLMDKLKCKGGFPMPMSVRADLVKDKGNGAKNKPKVAPTGDAVTPSELKRMRQEAKDKKAAEKAEEEAAAEAKAQAAEEAKRTKAAEKSGPRIRVPKHRLIHSGSVDLADYMEAKNQPAPTTTTVPKVLRLIVELPTVKKSSDVTLEVTCNNIVVEVPDKYYLDLPLSYEVDDGNGTAKFDKSKQELTLELPVIPKPPIFVQAPDHRTFGADDDEDEEEGGGLRDALDEAREAEEEEQEQEQERKESEEKQKEKQQEEDTQEGKNSTDESATRAEDHSTETQEQKPRERLEFSNQSDPLRIASVTDTDGDGQVGPVVLEEKDDVEEEAEEAELPPFVAAESFEGARPGYFFGTGLEGLGYYRDPKQPAKGQNKSKNKNSKNSKNSKEVKLTPTEDQEAQHRGTSAAEPLVQEVARAEKVVEAVKREPLPPAVQVFKEESQLLSRRLPKSQIELAYQTPVDILAHQNRQNVMLTIPLPNCNEVADVQVSVQGHQLTLTFCTRERLAEAPPSPSSSSSSAPRPWQKRRVRGLLGGLIDVSQCSSDVVRRGEENDMHLRIVARKMKTGDRWSEVVDFNSVPALNDRSDTGAAAAEEDAENHPNDISGKSGGAVASDTNDNGDDEGERPQDSEQLDVGQAEVGPSMPGPNATAFSAISPGAGVPANASMVQSAMVMGQSVILTSRLMYQLL